MNRTLWVLALVADVLGLFSAFPLFLAQPSAASMAWGTLVLAIFLGLLLLLLRPQVFGGHKRRLVAARVLSTAVPAAVLVASLDVGTISGQETVAIAIAVLVGWLNWAAVRRQNYGTLANAA